MERIRERPQARAPSEPPDNACAPTPPPRPVSPPRPGPSREVAEYESSFEYHEFLGEIDQNLMAAIQVQMRNNSAYVRSATITLLDFLAKTTLDIDPLLDSWVRELRMLIRNDPRPLRCLLAGFPSVVHRQFANGATPVDLSARSNAKQPIVKRCGNNRLGENRSRHGQRCRSEGRGDRHGQFQAECL